MITEQILDRIAALPAAEREPAIAALLEDLSSASAKERKAGIAALRARFGSTLDIPQAELDAEMEKQPHDPRWGDRPSSAAAAEADRILAKVFALSRKKQDRLIAEMLASPDQGRNALGKDLRDAITMRRLAGLG